MDERWQKIPEFPNYSISDCGRVQNNVTNRIMAQTRNGAGLVMVGMISDHGENHKRGVARLVARAFLEPSKHGPAYDTPINVDGNRLNNHVSNLMWRPRWFAQRYHKQFIERYPFGINEPIRNTATGEVYANTLEAAAANGLLEKEVAISVRNMTYTWPTYQTFEMVLE